MRGLLAAALVLGSLIALFTAATPWGDAAPRAAQAQSTAELFFSEYVEGSSNNKALEIYNGTGAAVDLAAGGYTVENYSNGGTTAGLTIPLIGTVANGDVFVLAHLSAVQAILTRADQTAGGGWYNGNDAAVLRKGGTIVDVIGQIGFDPGAEWGTGLTSTADNTLRRRPTVTAGDANGGDAFDPSVEWTGFATDTFDGLGSHTATEEATPTATPTPGDSPTPTATITGTISPTVTSTATLTPTATFTPSATATPPSPGSIRIRDIQGASHLSPLRGTAVANVPGIVTIRRSNGFYMQDLAPDANDATSEGIFVFSSSAPAVNVGDTVLVSGTVTEFRPGGGGELENLTTTEITLPTTIVASSGNPTPTPVVIGAGGRVPPTMVIDDDATGDVETSGTFDPATDGIDFYESLEGMLAQVNNAVATGRRQDFGGSSEITVLGDNGSTAGVRTIRGGIVIRSNDFNPERIFVQGLTSILPPANVGNTFTGPIVGVIDYTFGNFKLSVASVPAVQPAGLARESTTTAGPDQLAIATFNVENLDPSDGAAKFNALAGLIVNNLKSPDLVVVEEIQDNNGATNNTIVDATDTYNTLIGAITTAGGPTYQFRNVNPVDDQDGGEPGGNIRVGFLFRTDRGLAFVDRDGPGDESTTPITVSAGPGGPELSASPGRIDPANTAFESSRKPLAGEFTFNGRKLFLIGNHFTSKGGDHSLFAHFQPPVLSSEAKRVQQAQIVNDFVDSILALDANANVVVLGDLNDFEFSPPVTTLEGSILFTLIETLPQAERYSYVFEGNSQALDHIVVSSNLFNNVPFEYDIVHVNAEFFDQASDHDPQVVRFSMPVATSTPTPTATATVTPTPTATSTPTATDVPTSTATTTATDVPTSTPTPTPTEAPTSTATATATDVPTSTATPSPPATEAPTSTETATLPPTFTATASPSPTPTRTATETATATATATPSVTSTATATATPSVTSTATATLVGPPGNDNFANARPLGPSGLTFGNTAGATFQPGEPRQCGAIGKTVWFRIVAGTTGQLVLTTAGSQFNTVLAAYQGASLATLTPLGCNNNGGPGQTSRLVVPVTAGQTYFVQLGGAFGDSGAYLLRSQPAGGSTSAAENETEADAAAID